MTTVWRVYSRILERYPWKTQAIQTGVMVCIGDATAQLLVERKKLTEFDLQRTGSFAVFGLLMGCCLAWYLSLDRFFGVSGKTVIVKKVFVDQAVFAPFAVFGVFSLIGLLQQHPLNEIKLKLQQDYFDVVKAGWMIWPGVQLINFYLTPMQHRILVVNVVALFWNTYLSYKTSKTVKPITN